MSLPRRKEREGVREEGEEETKEDKNLLLECHLRAVTEIIEF